MTINDLKQYEVLDEHNIPDVASMGYVLRHKKSGARIAVLSNNDENKVFYIGFRTTPDDETGVPHIIEHTTLCGSEKFPVKDPFIELAKGSLNTFLNAMTYPDKTMYPIGSCNDQDFKNLMDVYMDAVFNPNITKYKEIFKQEGWHFELESKDAPITINGVVYNEMKGAYSSADEVLSNQIYRSLFPDNTYSKDSGGNPIHIPELTYEKYLDFYHKYYHPSNSYIYLYGDMDIVERLKWLDEEYLSKYDYMEVDSQIKPQKAFDKVKYVESEYSIASDDPEENKISPFAQLGLLKKDRNNYIKTQPDKDKLCDDAVLYSLIKFFEKKEVDSIGIDELLNSPMSPGRILNLKRMALNEYLDHLEGQGYLTVNRTAGLDMVYLKKKIELKEVVSNYYIKH